MAKITTAPDHTGVSVKAIALTSGALPDTYTAAVAIGHMEDFTEVIGKSRPVKKYTPINDKDFSQIVSTGAIEYDAFNASVLYDPKAKDGINMIEKAFDGNTEIGIIIELNNGVVIAQIVKVSSFKIKGEKDGKLMADISAEFIGNPTIKGIE